MVGAVEVEWAEMAARGVHVLRVGRVGLSRMLLLQGCWCCCWWRHRS
jgi:hypothetical protein